MIRLLKNIKMFFLLLFILTLIGSCKKGWLDVNYNPREITDSTATPDVILAPQLENVAFKGFEFDVLNMWLGYWCSPQIPPGLNITNYYNVEIKSGYPLFELAFLEQKASATGQTFYAGIAKTLNAFLWSRSVDLVNNLPYSEAFKSDILRPKYDKGQDIYEDVIRQLTIASSMIKSANVDRNVKISVADIMFRGDKIKWLKFINTLKLRLLIHQVNRPERAAYIAREMQVIMDEGSGFLITDAAVNPGYAVGKKISHYFGLYSSHNFQYGGSRGDLVSGISSTDFAHANVVAMNFLKSTNDPRIGFFYSEVDLQMPANAPDPFPQPGPKTFRGSQFGLTVNQPQFPNQTRPYLSAVGGSRNTGVVTPSASGIIKGNNMNTWVITSVESQFLQAEAVFRGWLPGNPEQAYKTAVKVSFRWLNVGKNTAQPQLSDAVFDQWYASETASGDVSVSWGAAADKYKLIMFQKYMALNGIEPLETWVDYRRNGRFPDIPPSVDPSRFGPTIPIRLAYPLNEYSLNPENVKAQGEINIFTGKIWWMP
jgi:hypothetical protein